MLSSVRSSLARSARPVRLQVRQASSSSSGSAPQAAEQATQKAQQAADKAKEVAGQASQRASQLLGSAQQTIGNALGCTSLNSSTMPSRATRRHAILTVYPCCLPTAYKQPIFYNVSVARNIQNHAILPRCNPRSDEWNDGCRLQAAVAKEFAKQVYQAEKLSPPSFSSVSYACTLASSRTLRSTRELPKLTVLGECSLCPTCPDPRQSSFAFLTQNPAHLSLDLIRLFTIRLDIALSTATSDEFLRLLRPAILPSSPPHVVLAKAVPVGRVQALDPLRRRGVRHLLDR